MRIHLTIWFNFSIMTKIGLWLVLATLLVASTVTSEIDTNGRVGGPEAKPKVKTFETISRDGRHQMAGYGGELVLEAQTIQLIFEKNFTHSERIPIAGEDNDLETAAQEFFPSFVAPPSFTNNRFFQPVASVPQCPKPSIRCFNSKYRTIDGSCNNLGQPRWGKSFECYKRLLSADYRDNFMQLRTSISGQELPNARQVSLRAHTGQMAWSRDLSAFVMHFGQFLDHDLTMTPVFRLPNGVVLDCCNSNDRFRVDRCAPVQFSSNDPFYSNFRVSCMNFVRSSPCLTCTNGARTQVNQLTSFVDASNIYGSLPNQTGLLRSFDGTGQMRSSSNGLLPSSTNPRTDQCSRPEQNRMCFGSGDSRVNLTPGLTSLHTVFHRHHNRLAFNLRRVNPHWNDETLFQEARRILIAQMQMAVYNEFLPVVLGPTRMSQFNLFIRPVGSSTPYTAYNPNIDATIFTEFSTAAYRFGHSLISPQFHRMGRDGRRFNYLLQNNYFNPHVLKTGDMDSIIRGMMTGNTARVDPFIADDVRNHLYRRRTDGFGSDLISFNIQRGRDHGLPGYIHYMKLCFNERINSFEQLDGYMPRQQRLRLQSLYANVQDIDLFTGGVSEFPLRDGHVGPTFACIIGRQFSDLKFGDRFYFEHGNQAGSFSPGQLDTIKQTTLAKIICDNGDDFPRVHRRVMEPTSENNPIIDCSSLPSIDFNQWKE